MSALLVLVAPAFACSLLGPEPLALVDDPTDTAAPAAPVIGDVVVTRGQGPRGNMASSCDDLGTIAIAVSRPDGDPDGPEAVGYLLALVDGELPDGLGLPTEAWKGPDLLLSWIDEATDDQEAFGFTLEITPIDAAGNVGEPVDVRVEDPGDAVFRCGNACSSAGGSPGLAVGALAALALAARRRR